MYEATPAQARTASLTTRFVKNSRTLESMNTIAIAPSGPEIGTAIHDCRSVLNARASASVNDWSRTSSAMNAS